jgi:hypothetical protein
LQRTCRELSRNLQEIQRLEKQHVLMCGDFLKRRRAQRLGVYLCFMKKVIKKVV